MDRTSEPITNVATRPLTQIEGRASFWSDLRQATSTALLLDYDGTLAPFAIDRLAALPLPGVVPALQAIREQTDSFIALVTGRPVSELRQLLGLADLMVIGSHGWETAMPGALPVTRALQPARSALLDAAAYLAAEHIDRSRIERKHASVAVHLRGLQLDDAATIAKHVNSAWSQIVAEGGVTVRPFNGGLELRVSGWDKGTAIADVLETVQPDFAAYLGDDDTDEDAFAVISRWGVGILVGDARPTRAAGRLDMQAAPGFLDDWARVLAKARRPEQRSGSRQ
ncbi:MAG: trehalose-phosphatase [Chloroflexi bacterium]|nr:MAG: trehalose-phosphatase [Chloroflexota bacterium]